jgi:hypothetical protein
MPRTAQHHRMVIALGALMYGAITFALLHLISTASRVAVEPWDFALAAGVALGASLRLRRTAEKISEENGHLTLVRLIAEDLGFSSPQNKKPFTSRSKPSSNAIAEFDVPTQRS